MEYMRPVVVTGVSGFVGRHVAKTLLERGVAVRGLLRSRKRIATPIPDGVAVFEGEITDPKIADKLTSGAEAVIHCAGAIRARSRREFFVTNVQGTECIVAAAAQSGVARFVHVSSIAAREPGISDYAASKREGENAVVRAGRQMSWIVIRPPAVYGPGDRATLPLLRALSQATALLPGTRTARFSLIHVADLARALATVATTATPAGQFYEVDDAQPGGYGWSDIEAAVSRNDQPTRIVLIPKFLLIAPVLLASFSTRLLFQTPEVSVGKLNELYHPDWVVRGGRLEAVSDWRPERGLGVGLAETMTWYRELRSERYAAEGGNIFRRVRHTRP
jgi:nucleoside-diphosphate-sugar epimerase